VKNVEVSFIFLFCFQPLVHLAHPLLSTSVKVMDPHLVVVQCDAEVVGEAVVHLMPVEVAAEVVVVVIVVAIKTI
jgi:hypothetical protein